MGVKVTRAGIVAVLVGLWSCALPMAGGAAQVTHKPYDTVVTVMARAPGPNRVVVVYSKVVDHKALRAGIAELGERAGVKPSGVVVRESLLARELTARGTDVEFSAPGLVPPAGALPVGAIIRSLPEWEHMRLVFLLDKEYAFSGPLEATAGGFAARLVNQGEAYEYDVERIGRTGAATVAAAWPSARKRQPSASRGRSSAVAARTARDRAILPAVLIGLPSGLLAGWLVYGWWDRLSRVRRGRAAREPRPSSGLRPGEGG
jgi:hypothetical protein